MDFDLTCSTDNNYVQHCMAMLCSVFDNNSEHRITVHVLHSGLSVSCQDLILELGRKYKQKIIFYDIDLHKLEGIKINKEHPDLSIATYFRFFLSSFLDNSIKRVLYLDCDVIVLRDISELFTLNMENYGVAGVKDYSPYNDIHRKVMGQELDDRGFNAGVLMINLDYWRKHHAQDKLLSFALNNSKNVMMEDQDALNYVFRQKWFMLPYKYGWTPMSVARLDRNQRTQDIYEYVFSPSILHYAAHTKPWLDISIPGDKSYWKYVKLSGYPNPKRTKASSKNKKRIRKTKIRYYINYNVRPFIPNIIEMVIVDIYNLICLLSFVVGRKGFKQFRLKRWLSKYGF